MTPKTRDRAIAVSPAGDIHAVIGILDVGEDGAARVLRFDFCRSVGGIEGCEHVGGVREVRPSAAAGVVQRESRHFRVRGLHGVGREASSNV